MSEQQPSSHAMADALQAPVGEATEHVTYHGHSPEEIKAETRVYLFVFIGLAFLTMVTVAVSYLRLPIHLAIILALCIAGVKAFLVAGYFMHLLSEKKLVYSVLALTAIFFIFLIFIPLGAFHSKFGHY